MIRSLFIIGLELYALLLAWLQSLGGIRTDEAKLLLNIPYPHPPLLRWIVHQTEFLSFQEMLCRVLLATLLVQAVWLVWDMGKGLRLAVRLLAAALWLFSVALLQQAGSIMAAPVTAVEGLLLLWLLHRVDDGIHRSDRCQVSGCRFQVSGISLVVVVWLLSLFTAYQVVLYLPIVVAALRRLRVSWRGVAWAVGVPLCLVSLYVLGNPLSLDRFVDAGTLNAGKTFLRKFADLGSMAMAGGSVAGALAGVYGIMLRRAWPLALSLLLIAAFIFLSLRSYYAVFFTPLFVAGAILLLRERPAWWKWIGIAHVLFLLLASPLPSDRVLPPARAVMQRLQQEGVQGDVLINGSFGHEWQYESRLPLRRYRPEFLDMAGAVVCLTSCGDLMDPWQKIDDIPVDAWVRR